MTSRPTSTLHQATSAQAIKEATLPRIDRVMDLPLTASLSAASIGGSTRSEHDRRQAELVTAALDEALVEQRIVRTELTSTALGTVEAVIGPAPGGATRRIGPRSAITD